MLWVPLVWLSLARVTAHAGTSPALLLAPASPPLPVHNLPLKFWANPRQSTFRPRKRDLHEPTLMAILGNDYDTLWMKASKNRQNSVGGEVSDEGERSSVRSLRAQVEVPASLDLPPELAARVASWLVASAACPVRYTWRDLGSDFWPRQVKAASCLQPSSNSSLPASCSWPPGMGCAPGPARHLTVLRWHCRLRVRSHPRYLDDRCLAVYMEVDVYKDAHGCKHLPLLLPPKQFINLLAEMPVVN